LIERVGYIDDRMNRNYDGCTDEHSLSQNLLMEKENKLSNKTFTCFVFTYSKILLFKCHTNEQRSNKYTNKTLKPCLKCLCLYRIL